MMLARFILKVANKFPTVRVALLREIRLAAAPSKFVGKIMVGADPWEGGTSPSFFLVETADSEFFSLVELKQTNGPGQDSWTRLPSKSRKPGGRKGRFKVLWKGGIPVIDITRSKLRPWDGEPFDVGVDNDLEYL